MKTKKIDCLVARLTVTIPLEPAGYDSAVARIKALAVPGATIEVSYGLGKMDAPAAAPTSKDALDLPDSLKRK